MIMPNYTKLSEGELDKSNDLVYGQEFILLKQFRLRCHSSARLTKEFGKTPRPIDLKKAMS